MDFKWVKIRSWHALRPKNHFGLSTYCGKVPADDAVVMDDLPAEQSCESCLRIVARIQEHAAAAG